MAHCRSCHHALYYNRERWRDRRYGLAPGQFDALVAAQSNRCAICNYEMGSGKRRHIDHDHTTGHVRGLLCSACNTALGRIETVGIESFERYLALDQTLI